MAGVIRAGVNGAGVKKGPAEKGPIRYTKALTNFQGTSACQGYNFIVWEIVAGNRQLVLISISIFEQVCQNTSSPLS